MSNSSSPMLKKKDKENIIRADFIEPEQIVEDMSTLGRHYDIDLSKADLGETRRILSKVSSLHKELAEMRDENM